MFMRSCGSLTAGPPQVSFALVGSSKELGVVPWWVSGLEAAAWMFNEEVLGWTFAAEMWLEYLDDTTSFQMADGVMLEGIGSHSVFLDLRVLDTVLIMAFS